MTKKEEKETTDIRIIPNDALSLACTILVSCCETSNGSITKYAVDETTGRTYEITVREVV